MKRLLLAIVLSLVFGQPAGADTVDLISLVDLDQNVVSGDWQLVNGELIVNGAAARISFPYRPPLEYDYTVEFILTHGSDPWDNMAQLVSHGDVPFTWSMNAGTGHFSRLEDINGHSVIGNPTLVFYPFVAGQRYTSIVRVRNDRVICEINGQTLVEYETDYTDLSRNTKWEMPDQLNIGLGGYGGPTTIHSARVTTLEACDIDELQQQLDDMYFVVDSLVEQMTDLSGSYDALEQRTQMLESQVTTLFDENTILKEKITVLEDRISDHSHEYLTGEGRGHNSTQALTGPASFHAAQTPIPSKK